MLVRNNQTEFPWDHLAAQVLCTMRISQSRLDYQWISLNAVLAVLHHHAIELTRTHRNTQDASRGLLMPIWLSVTV
jgi:hypothetical protein